MIIEACVENFPESLIAEQKGAHRLELCENLAVGGTTPSYGAIKMCVDKIKIPTLVMIRPRGGNFVYSDAEMQTMLLDIKVCVDLGVSGVVFGCLNEGQKSIHYAQMETLIKAAGSLDIVLHRAYDLLDRPWEELEKLKAIGVRKILSAGGMGTIFEGKEALLNTLRECQKLGLDLTAAGKITTETLKQAQEAVPAPAFHGRSIVGALDH